MGVSPKEDTEREVNTHLNVGEVPVHGNDKALEMLPIHCVL